MFFKTFLMILLSFLPVLGTPTASRKPYTFKEAGLQFELPASWTIETSEQNGLAQHVLKSPDQTIAMFFVIARDAAMAERLWNAYREGVDKEMKNVKSDGQKEDQFNGMDHLTETGTGEADGHTLYWSLDIVIADKPVLMFGAFDQAAIEKHGPTLEKVLASLKHLEH